MANITLPPAQPRTLEGEKSRDQLAATTHQVQLVGGRTTHSPSHTHHHSPSRVNATCCSPLSGMYPLGSVAYSIIFQCLMIVAKTGPKEGFASQCPADCGAHFLTYNPLSTKVNERSSVAFAVVRGFGHLESDSGLRVLGLICCFPSSSGALPRCDGSPAWTGWETR